MRPPELKNWLRGIYTPVVQVIPTTDAEAICLKNGLTFAETLRPFCNLRNLNVPIRTAGEHAYRLQDFKIRILNAKNIEQHAVEVAEEQLTQIVSQAAEVATDEGWSKEKQIGELLNMRRDPTPWFTKYQSEFLNALTFSDHEAFDHPVACLLVVPSTDPDPVKTFLDLYSTHNVPTLIREGIADPQLLKHYVLLHDMQSDVTLERAEQVFIEMKSTLGAGSCQLVAINSRKEPEGDSEHVRPDLWGDLCDPAWQRAAHLSHLGIDSPEELRMGKNGAQLTEDDLVTLDSLVKDFTIKVMLPYMENRVVSLNQQVTDTRKGLKNQLKSFWGYRKEKPKSGPEGQDALAGGGHYAYNSPESQLRILADLAFLLRDYELALSHYRLLAADYKADKAWKRFAGVQEAMGLTLFMTDGARREMEICFDSAFQSYSRCASPNGVGQSPVDMGMARYSTRSMLFLSSIFRSHGMFRDATLPLMRASYQESPLRAALLLEQSAYCYLHSQPQLLRKFGFHMVLAGQRYNSCHQRWHAIRAYTTVLGVYCSKGWAYIEEHLHFALGRQVSFIGDLAGSVQYLVKLLGACSHQPAALQATYLREFLYVMQCLSEQGRPGGDMDPAAAAAAAAAGAAAVAAALPAEDLPLPEVNLERIHVHFHDHRSYASPSAVQVGEEVWSQVEAPVVPVAQAGPTWMDGNKATKEVTNTCVAGEEIGVDVELCNRLQVQIEVSQVRLLCAHEGRAEGEPISDYVEVQEEAISLKPGESSLLRLRLRPLREGVLRIQAVQWVLCSVAPGCKRFRQDPPEGARPGDRATPPHKRLVFTVVPPLPRVEAKLEGLPSVMFEGEIHRCILELSNVARPALQNIKLSTTSPGLLCGHCPQELKGAPPGCLEVGAQEEVPPESCGSLERAVVRDPYTGEIVPAAPTSVPFDSVFVFPPGTVLEGEAQLRWPVWIRSGAAGLLALNLVVYYEPQGACPGPIKYRVLRMGAQIQVNPSVRAEAQLSPCRGDLQRHLLNVHLQSLHPSQQFRVRQLSCLRSTRQELWQLAPLSSPDTLELAPGEQKPTPPGGACGVPLTPSSQSRLLFHLTKGREGAAAGASGAASSLHLEPAGSGRGGAEDADEEAAAAMVDMDHWAVVQFLRRAKAQHLADQAAKQRSNSLTRRPSIQAAGPSQEERADREQVELVLVWEVGADGSAGVASPGGERALSVAGPARMGVHFMHSNSLNAEAPLRCVLEGPSPHRCAAACWEARAPTLRLRARGL
ncbi:hypothetical protein CYMTET_49920 [Cymbomonas tetramitiformis]|uniref:Trafficking protein particle complex subunit 8 n=1 Tax=Cymbomonas tetramitiformis TaxID=36881 RepID=A0AAE0BQX6_9CHLO|nr:hypothetical protein CYMTET_49920 [Cymbomonas tetramitiformis]